MPTKLCAAQRLRRATNVPHPWAKAMLDVVAKYKPKIAKELQADYGEGIEISAKDGKALIAAFKSWSPYEEIKKLWVIESREEGKGISIDFRPDMIDEPNTCILAFYEE